MDLLITVLALLVAIYSVLPRERRLDLRLRFGTIDIIIFAVGVGVVTYLDLYGFFKVRGLVMRPPQWTVGLTTVQAAHIILLAMLISLGLRTQTARLSP